RGAHPAPDRGADRRLADAGVPDPAQDHGPVARDDGNGPGCHREARERRSAPAVLAPGKLPVVGKIYDTIDEHLVAWIGRQSMFFVGSAPAGGDGHINLSPKGPIQTLRILDERTVAYLD